MLITMGHLASNLMGSLHILFYYGNLCRLLVGMSIGTTIVENSVEVLKKIKNKNTILSSNSPSGYIAGGNNISLSERYLYSHIHFCIIYNSHYNGILFLFSFKKKILNESIEFVLSKINQTQDKYRVISFIFGI